MCIGGERELTWKKINVDGGYGFAEIDYVGDVAQIYADGELVADDYITARRGEYLVNCFTAKNVIW